MRLTFLSTAFLLLAPSIIAHPQPVSELSQRDALAILDAPTSELHDHWKRKGGGGGGGKGGGGGGGGKSSGSSSSSSSSSSSGGRTSGSSNAGGATSRGSGVTKNYGGGRYYGGGATVPYKSGGRTPSGIAAVPLVGAALLVYPGVWFYGAYAYPYYHPYSYYNRTARRNRTATATTTSPTSTPTTNSKRGLVERMIELIERQDSGEIGANETKPVTCLCALYAVCGCDDNSDTSFLASIIGDGDYAKLNTSLVQVADINGTSTIVLNGTLPNGTTASGGTDSAAASIRPGGLMGYAVMVALVGFTCFLI